MIIKEYAELWKSIQLEKLADASWLSSKDRKQFEYGIEWTYRRMLAILPINERSPRVYPDADCTH